MHETLANWWKRIVLFLALLTFFVFILAITFNLLGLISILGREFSYPLIFLLSLLFSSFIIELQRVQSKFYNFGLMFTKNTLFDILLATIITFVPFLLILLILYCFGHDFKMNFVDIHLLNWFILWIFLLASFEELIFRGIIFQALIGRFSNYFVLIFSNLIFAAMHFENAHFNYLTAMNTFLAGILLGVMYIQTKSLYLPIFFHFFWNFLQVLILNSNISGNEWGYNLFDLNYNGLPQWLFGGSYGIEGGFLCTILLVVYLPIIIRFSNISPFVAQKIFRRNLAESKYFYKI